jgi:hypothetical protein
MRTPAPLPSMMAVALFTCAACSASSSSPAPSDAGGLEPDADAAIDGASTDGSPADANDTCNHPATTTYACSPMPPSEGACEGGPPQAGDAGPAASYPLGCVATLPSCNPLYGGEAMTCSCTPLGMTAMWVCPF